ncbi:MAG TPA: HlyD family efflux transporter periplasmic adaptor subunit [Rhodocyclaceae bacterium]|nr:HlyD family efflux transporter periplasmic adaptor subunit [Rhodocyclaceae bacterium]
MPDNEANTNSPADNKRKHRFAMFAVTAAVILAALAYGIYWAVDARYYESTDDAYVGGNLVQATPQIAGTIITVGADENDMVKRGQTLIVFDPAAENVALAQSEAALAKAVRQARNLFVGNSQYEATVKLREVELQQAQANLSRRTGLDNDGVVSTEEVQHARDAVAAAQANLDVDTEHLKSNRALTERTSIASYPDVLVASERVRAAYLDVLHTRIVSPIDGYIAKRSAQVGQRVSEGMPLMAIVPLNDIWVEANFKEDQLGGLRIGQPVELSSDLYGGKVTYNGKISGLGIGTGSALSVLPAQNASGNWIKVVQRLPVRIALDANQLARYPLRVGLSMNVTVDIHQQNGPVLATSPNMQASYSVSGQDAALREADNLINRIVRENAGSDAAVAHGASAGSASGHRGGHV